MLKIRRSREHRNPHTWETQSWYWGGTLVPSLDRFINSQLAIPKMAHPLLLSCHSQSTLYNIIIPRSNNFPLWFNIKIPSDPYTKSHCGDKMILRPSYLHNGISYTGKMASLHWISPRITGFCEGNSLVSLWKCFATTSWNKWVDLDYTQHYYRW